MHKKLVLISKIILIIALLNVFAWTIFHVHNGGTRLGVLTKPIKEFSMFPKLVADVFREIQSPQRFVKFEYEKPINKLDYDVYAAYSIFKEGNWEIKLLNLKNDSIIFEWILKKENFNKSNVVFSHSTIRVPVVLPDTSLILMNDVSRNMFRINSKSEIIWHNTDFQFHHSLNPDADGNVWACTKIESKDSIINSIFLNDCITKIDAETGNVLFHKSLSEIFNSNDLNYLVHGISNFNGSVGIDPFHLNEIEPVKWNGSYWKKGDLFLSLRNRSLILLYRPSSNKIIRIIHGPFYHQHDVDIISDSTISIFNNNVSGLAIKAENHNFTDTTLLNDTSLNTTSGVLVYNFPDSSFKSLYPNQFYENKIFTTFQGLHHILPNKDMFIENYEEGRIYIFNNDDVLLKRYLNKEDDGFVERSHWIRIYEDLSFLN